MKKRSIILLFLALFLAACGAEEAAVPESVVTEAPTLAPTAAPEEDPVRMAVFQAIVQRLYTDHIGPGGEQLAYTPEFGSFEQNRFAIGDVDGDGQKELILSYSSDCMAGMAAWIVGFDGQEPYVELCEFPTLDFYRDGIVAVQDSHNHGLAGDRLWPYTLMRYNPDTREYESITRVDAWDGELWPENYDGTPFPAELDTDGEGAVYLVTQNGITQTLSRTRFDAWNAETYAALTPLTLTFRSITQENINGITDWG